MTDDSDPADGTKRISDSVFLGIVTIITLLVLGLVFFLLRPGDDTGAAPSVSGPGANHSLPQPSPTQSSPSRRPDPPVAGAQALVRTYFRLSSSGQHEAACALESPAYRKFDAAHYRGGCVGGSGAVTRALAAHGLSMQVTGTKVVDHGGGSATILTDLKVGTHTGSEYVYLVYHAGRWWISGSNDSLDLGY